MLAVDDAHWADAASLHWLAVLSSSLHELPAAVVCAVRAGEPAAAPDLLAEVLAAAPEPPLRPRPLGTGATSALIRSRCPGADDAFVRACHEVTGGNPFLLVTLLAQLAADGVPPTRETAARLATFGTEQVARNVERQLARLPGGAGELARAVAVLGPGAPLRRAAALAGLDMPVAAGAADALRAAGLLDRGSELSLVHPLIASALYAGIPPGRRSVSHAAAARLLAAEGAGSEAVGLHLVRSEPAGDQATVRTLHDAATRATTRGAPLAAAAFLRRALAEPPEASHLADLRLDLGLALAWGVQPDAYEHLAGAVAAADSRRRSGYALRGARALGLLGEFEHAFALGRLGLEDADDAPPQLRARLEAELVTDGWLQRTTYQVSRALSDAPRFPDLGLWRVNAAMRCAADAEPAARSLELLRPLLADDVLDREPESVLGTTATLCLIMCDEFGAARSRYDRIIETAAPRGWLIALAHGCMLRAYARLRCGEIRDAEADARLGFETKLQVAQPAAILWTLTFLVEALVELDEPDQAEAALAAAGQQGDPPTGTLGGPVLLQARARLRLAQLRPHDALKDACAAGERAKELQISSPVLADWRMPAVAALVTLGDRPTALPLAREQMALAEGVGTPSACGAALRTLALALEEPAERLAHLQRAVDMLAMSPTRLEHTRALVDLGAALRRGNRRADARDTLRLALEQAERGGMRLLARRAREELLAAGARPRRGAVSGPGSLTAAEDRVARLAADGHTNRTIAERLYVTERTVETHLTRAFDKLNITSRTALATALGEPVRP